MSRNSVNKAVFFIADDDYNNGIKLPAKTELNNIISDMLKSSKNDIRMVPYDEDEENENQYQEYIPMLRKQRRDRNDVNDRIRQRMETEKIAREMSEKEDKSKMFDIARRIALQTQQEESIKIQKAKEEAQAKEIEMIMGEIKKRIVGNMPFLGINSKIIGHNK